MPFKSAFVSKGGILPSVYQYIGNSGIGIVSQGSDGRRIVPVAVVVGEGAQRNLARCDTDGIALGAGGHRGMVKPIDNSPEAERAKGRDMAFADMEVEEMGIDTKADIAHCRADLGMPCRTRNKRGEDGRHTGRAYIFSLTTM